MFRFKLGGGEEDIIAKNQVKKDVDPQKREQHGEEKQDLAKHKAESIKQKAEKIEQSPPLFIIDQCVL